MKVVVAMDSFKGSLTSLEAGNAAKAGILAAIPDAMVVVKPLADGGEGTADVLMEELGGERIPVKVTGPMKTLVNTYYGYVHTSQTAILEMAGAAGITLVSENEKNPMAATTFGVGEMIKDALDRGCRDFIIGIGGSATNDGGIGMLKALGYQFLTAEGEDAGEGGQALGRIAAIRTEDVDPRLMDCRFRIACDVRNPLCGMEGATYVYGAQKGVTEEMKEALDQAMAHYAEVTAIALGEDHSHDSGSGAAGGMGFAFLSYLGAELVPGIELILDVIGLESELADADIVVTGEGRLDYQTAMGKTPAGVARIAKQYDKMVLAFAGGVTLDAHACNDVGIDAFFPIVRGVTTLEEAMKPVNAKANMSASVEQVFRAVRRAWK